MGKLFAAAVAAVFLAASPAAQAQTESPQDRAQERSALRSEFFGEEGRATLLNGGSVDRHERAYSRALFQLDKRYAQPLSQDVELLRRGRCSQRSCADAWAAISGKNVSLKPAQSVRATPLASGAGPNSIALRWTPPAWARDESLESEVIRYEIAIIASDSFSVYSASDTKKIPLRAPRRGKGWTRQRGVAVQAPREQFPQRAHSRVRRSAYIDGIEADSIRVSVQAVYIGDKSRKGSGTATSATNGVEVESGLSERIDFRANTIGDISFDDPDLRDCIVKSYPKGAKTPLSDVVSLDCSLRNISGLGGIENLQWLKTLNLFATAVHSVDALGELSSLQSLNLGQTAVSRVDALGGLSGLRYLYLSSTQVTNISPLVNISALEELTIQGSQVSAIPDMTATSLTYLDASDNPLVDISGLRGVDGLETFVFQPVYYLNGNTAKDLFGDISALVDTASSPQSQLSDVDLSGNNQIYCFHLDTLEAQLANLGGSLERPGSCADIPVPSGLGGAPQISEFNNYIVSWNAEGQLSDSYFRIEEVLPETDHRVFYSSDTTQLDMGEMPERRVGIFQYRVQHCYQSDAECSGWSTPYDQIILASPSVPGDEILAQVPDPALQTCLASHLEYETDAGDTGYLTNGELASIDCRSWGVADLSGIELFPNLRSLQFYDNQISELAPIELILDAASLGQTPVTLSLQENEIESAELAHVAVPGSPLRQLYLSSNHITDIGHLSDLDGLIGLLLDGNSIADLSPVSDVPIYILRVERNNLTTIPPLRGTGSIKAGGNSIANVAGLETIQDTLVELDLSDNPVMSDDLGDSLTDAPSLDRIYLDRTNVTDVSFLAAASGLRRFSVNETSVSSLSGVENLAELREVRARQTQIGGLEPLAGAERLNVLELSGGTLSGANALEPLLSLENLGELVLADNNVTDASPLIELMELPDSSMNPDNFSRAAIDISGERFVPCGQAFQIYERGVLRIDTIVEPECRPDDKLGSTAWLQADLSTFDVNWERSLVPPGYYGTTGYEIEYAASDGAPTATVSVEGALQAWAQLNLTDAVQEEFAFRVRACRGDGICGEYADWATKPYYPIGSVGNAQATLNPDNSASLSMSYIHPTDTPQSELFVELGPLFADMPMVSVPYTSQDIELNISGMSGFPGSVIRIRVCRLVAGDKECGPTREIRAIEPEIDPQIPVPTGLTLGDDQQRLRLDHGEHFLSWNEVDDPRVDYYRVQRLITVNGPYETTSSFVESDYNLEAPRLDIKRFDGDPAHLTSYRVQACQKSYEAGDVCSDFAETEAMRIDGVESVTLSGPTNMCWFWSESDDIADNEFSLRWTYPASAADSPRRFVKGATHRSVAFNDSSGYLVDSSGEQREYWEINNVTTDQHNIGFGLYEAIIKSTFRNKQVARDVAVQVDDNGSREWNDSTRCNESALVQNPQLNNLVGPASLSPGHYTTWSGDGDESFPGAGTGWSFYWTKEPRFEGVNDSFGRAYDLLAFWYTYRKLEGESELTPVWYYARLHQPDAENSDYVSGTLMYPQAGLDSEGNSRNDVSVGEVRIQFRDNRKQAEVLLDVRHDSHLSSFSTGGVGEQFESFSIRDVSTDSDLVDPVEDFGGPNPTDHYSGIWTPDPDSPFTDIDQILEQNEAFFSEWIVGNFSSIGVKSFDLRGEPIWFIQFKCQYSDASDHCYSGDTPIDFSLSRHMDGFNTVFPGPGTGPLDPMTATERSQEGDVIAAGGSGLRRSYNDVDSDQVHTQQRRGSICVDLSGSLPPEGTSPSRPYDIQIGNGGNGDCSSGFSGAEESISKIANLHYISYVLNGDPDRLTCTAQEASEGACIVELTWFTDGYYPTAAPVVTLNGNDPTSIADVCENIDSIDGYSPYQDSLECQVSVPGQYRFHLGNRLEAFGSVFGEDSEEIATTRRLLVEQDLDQTPVSPPQAPFESPTLTQDEIDETSRVGATPGDFKVSESGAAIYNIPIMTAPAPGDVAPTLSITYNSATGNGRLGPKWDISGLSMITRCRKTIESGDEAMGNVDFGSDDRFCLDGARLKLTGGGTEYGAAGTVYRLEIDNFTRIEAVGQVQGEPAYFLAHGSDGSTRMYGSPDAQSSARIDDSGSGEIVSWPISEFRDSASNFYQYTYFRRDFSSSQLPNETLEWGIQSVVYTGNDTPEADTEPFARINFQYKDLPLDQQVTAFLSGVRTARTMVIDRVQSIHDEKGTLRDYRLFFSHTGPEQSKYVLDAIHECWDGSDSKNDFSSCFNPTEFEWEHDTRSFSGSVVYSIDERHELKAIRSDDVNGDGKSDLVYFAESSTEQDGGIFVGLSNGEGGLNLLEPFEAECLAGSSAKDSFFLADPFGDGASSLFFAADCGSGLMLWRRSVTASNNLSARQAVIDLPSEVDPDDLALSMLDWTGDGVLDLIAIESGDLPKLWVAENLRSGNGEYGFAQLSQVSLAGADEWWDGECPDGYDLYNETHEFELLARAAFNFDGASRASFVTRHSMDLHCEDDGIPDRSDYVVSSDPRYRVASIASDGSGYELLFEMNGLLPEMTHVVSGDINGDGYSDLVYFTNEGDDEDTRRTANLAVNKGGEFHYVDLSALGSDIHANSSTQYAAKLMDYDGDGHLDLFVPSSGSDAAKWKIYLWRWQEGQGRFLASPIDGPLTGDLFGDDSGSTLFPDLNGDSRPDYVLAKYTGEKEMGNGGPIVSTHSIMARLGSSWASGGGATLPPGYVVSYENGFGAQTDIEYRPLTDRTVYERGTAVSSSDYGYGSLVYGTQQSVFVVSSVVSAVPQHQPDPAAGDIDYVYDPAGTATVRYHYSGARIQSGGRGYLGFREVSSYDAQSGVLTMTRFAQNFPYVGRPESTRTWHLSINPWVAPDLAPTLPAWPDIQDCDKAHHVPQSDALLSGCSENVWDFIRRPDDGVPDLEEKWSDDPIASLFLSTTIEWNIEVIFDGSVRSGKLTHHVVTNRSEMDQYGNPGRVETYTYAGNDEEPLETKISENLYSNYPQKWHLGRLVCTRVRTERSNAPANMPPIVRVTGFGYDASTGLLNREVVEPDDCECSLASGSASAASCSGEGLLVEDHEHDDFGNRIWTEKIARDEDTGLVEARRLAGREFGPHGALVSSEYEGAAYAGGQWLTALVSEYLSHDQYGNPGIVIESGGLAIEKRYDRMGRPLETESPTGSFNRTIRTAAASPGGAVSGCPTDTAFKETTSNGAGVVSEVCKDVLGRNTRSRSLGFSDFELDSGAAVEPWVHVDIHYDYASRVVEKSEPYFAALGGSQPETAVSDVFWSRKLHDELGRIIEVTRPLAPGENASESVIYEGLRTKTINDQGQVAVVQRSPLGEKVWERAPSGVETHFSYDHLGNLVVTDGPLPGAVDQIELHYDRLGHKELLSDPDKGDWHYEYNSFGELQHQVDAKGQATVVISDFSGRRSERLEYSPSSGSDYVCDPEGTMGLDGCVLRKETTWAYGEPGSSEYGQVVKTTSTDFPFEGDSRVEIVERFDYDWAGRLFQKTSRFDDTLLPGQAVPEFVERWTYDEYGREFQYFNANSSFALEAGQCTVTPGRLNLSDQCLAGGEGTLRVYNEYGHVAVLKESKYSETNHLGFDEATYWLIGQKDARGNVVEATMGNQQRVSMDYSSATGWLAARLDSLGQVTAQAITYQWDSIGRLESRSDLVTATHGEVFSYDSENRLTAVQYTPTGDAGDLRTRQRVRYDEAGNITCKSDTYGTASVAAGASTTVCESGSSGPGEYHYNSSERPHAVLQAGNRHFEYDLNGNVVRDFSSNASEPHERVFEYTVSDRLRRVVHDSQSVSFFYGSEREKRVKRVEDGLGQVSAWTFYVGSAEITHSRQDLSVADYSTVSSGTSKRFIASTLIVEEDMDSGAISKHYLHKNHQGSIVAVSNRYGEVLAHMRYDAWGARRKVDEIHMQPPRWALSLRPFVQDFIDYTNRGYTGHEHLDSAGIIHMGGRIYDPILGRFLQGDPLVEDIATLNRYSYAHNNPLAYVDPNGFLSIGNLVKGLLSVAIGVFTGFTATAAWAASNYAAAIAIAAAGGAAAGVVATGTSEGALFGAFTAVATLGVTQYLKGAKWAYDGGSFTSAGNIARSVGHGLASGVSADLQGGKFGHAFFTAGVTSLASPGIASISDDALLNTAAAAILGGSLSEATGGKFANGAATGAMTYALSSASASSSGQMGYADKAARTASDVAYSIEKAGISWVGFANQGIPYSAVGGFSATLTPAPVPLRGSILSFSGTDFTSWGNIKANAGQAILGSASQYDQAVSLSMRVHDALGGDVILAGHSLGGGLAAAGAYATGADAITFNAAGLHPSYRTGTPGSIRSHYVRGDLLTVLQGLTPLPNAAGSAIPHSYGGSGFCGMICRHSIDSFPYRSGR